MAWIGAIVGMAGSIAGSRTANEGIVGEGEASYDEGFAIQREREFEAEQHDYFASQSRAAAQRSAHEERRIARIAESRAIAVAGASGGGVSDSSVLNIIGDIHQEQEYQALLAIFEGGQVARDHEIQASLLRYEGKEAVRSGQIALQRSHINSLANKQSMGQNAGIAMTSVANSYGRTSSRTPSSGGSPSSYSSNFARSAGGGRISVGGRSQ